MIFGPAAQGLGDATREDADEVLHFDIAPPDTAVAGTTLRELLRAAAAGRLAPADVCMRHRSRDDE